MTTVVSIKMTSNVPIVPRNETKAHEKGTQSTDALPNRLHARAVKRIFDRQTGDLVGWLYEWNTGALVPRWKSEAHEDVYFE